MTKLAVLRLLPRRGMAGCQLSGPSVLFTKAFAPKPHVFLLCRVIETFFFYFCCIRTYFTGILLSFLGISISSSHQYIKYDVAADKRRAPSRKYSVVCDGLFHLKTLRLMQVCTYEAGADNVTTNQYKGH